MVKKIAIAVVGILVIMQFFGIDKTVKPVNKETDFLATMQPPAEIAKLIKTSCYDCHSEQTEYPWYTNVAPISWWIGHHIEEGREHLSFSNWAKYDQKKAIHKLEEFYEEVEEGEMPLNSYTWMHAEASLSKEDKDKMLNWVKSLPGVAEELEEH